MRQIVSVFFTIDRDPQGSTLQYVKVVSKQMEFLLRGIFHVENNYHLHKLYTQRTALQVSSNIIMCHEHNTKFVMSNHLEVIDGPLMTFQNSDAAHGGEIPFLDGHVPAGKQW